MLEDNIILHYRILSIRINKDTPATIIVDGIVEHLRPVGTATAYLEAFYRTIIVNKSYCQYLRQLRKAEGGWRGMNAAQAGDLVENLGE